MIRFFDREAIEEAFRRLGGRLARRGLVADVYVFDGAAMALAYDARRATCDIDAVFEPHGVVLEEAWAVADELGLPRWWLSEQASAYVAPGGDPDAHGCSTIRGCGCRRHRRNTCWRRRFSPPGAAMRKTSGSWLSTWISAASMRCWPCAPRFPR